MCLHWFKGLLGNLRRHRHWLFFLLFQIGTFLCLLRRSHIVHWLVAVLLVHLWGLVDACLLLSSEGGAINRLSYTWLMWWDSADSLVVGSYESCWLGLVRNVAHSLGMRRPCSQRRNSRWLWGSRSGLQCALTTNLTILVLCLIRNLVALSCVNVRPRELLALIYFSSYYLSCSSFGK